MNRYANLIKQAEEKSTAKAGGHRVGRVSKPNDGSLNKTEAQYEQYLALRLRIGSIQAYWVHFIKIRLAKATFYDTDFLVQLPNGELELHEVKGFMEDDAAVKLKTAASLSPFRVIKVTKGKEGWEFEVVEPGPQNYQLPLAKT